MSLGCGGYSNDIFDVNNCSTAFYNCRTAEQIQVYLWQRIKEIQLFLNNFNTNQQDVNNDHNKRITNNSNAITNIRNELETLKKIANDLSTQMTEVKADVNAFKLEVDKTLNLYQGSIDKIVKNIATLTSNGEALAHRVSVLEQQTDLNKLQQIIKTWKEISDQFSAKLEESKKELHAYVDKAIGDQTIAVNKRLDEFLKLINNSAANVEKLTLISLDHTKHLSVIDNEIKEIDEKIDKAVADITKAYTEFTQEKVNEAVAYLNAVIERLETKEDNEVADLRASLELLKKDTQVELNKLTDLVNKNNEDQNKRIIEIHEELLQLATTINRIADDVRTAYDFANKALDYSKSASEAAGKATDLVLELRKEYELKWIRFNESLAFINADVIRHVFKTNGTDDGSWDIKIGVLTINGKEITINSTHYVYADSKNETTIFISRNISKMPVYEPFTVITGESYDTYILTLKQIGIEGDFEVRVIQHLNEFNKVYFEPVRVKDSDVVINPVDIDIHPFPEPPKPEICDPIKVVLVDDKCKPYNVHGRDGRDGRDGDNIENIEINVKEKKE